jgi:hypothetical protein
MGVITNGFIGTTLAARVRLSRLMLSGLIGTLLGLVLSTAGLRAALLGAFLLGFGGSVVIMSAQVVLVDAHRNELTRILGRTGFVSGLLAAATPALFGALSQYGRSALLISMTLPAAALVIAVALGGSVRREVDQASQQPISKESPVRLLALPQSVRWALAALFCFGAIEWSIIFWGAQALHMFPGLSVGRASASVSAFLAFNLLAKLWWAQMARGDHEVAVRRACSAVFGLVVTIWAAVAWTALASQASRWGIMFCALTAGLALGLAGCAQVSTAIALSVSAPLRSRSSARISLLTGTSVLILPTVLGLTLTHAAMPVSSTLLWSLAVLGLLALRQAARQKEPV